MNRTLIIIFLFIFAYAIQLNSATVEVEPEFGECMKCHEKIYQDSLTNPYQHGTVMDKCDLCHITEEIEEIKDEARAEENAEEKKASIDFPSYQKEGILHLDALQYDKNYDIEIIATDSEERESSPYQLNVSPEKEEEYDEDFNSLKNLSEITLEEVKKGVYVEATVSWTTDVPATSEVEYWLLNGRGSYFEENERLTKKHRITLTGLKHRHNYIYRVISRDTKGNIIESEENVINTSKEISDTQSSAEYPADPVINEVTAFRIKSQQGLYLRVSANKPSRLTVSLEEIMEVPEETILPEEKTADENHSPLLAQARYSTITACKNCHNQNASHPVGVRADNDKIRTPDDLPTIDGGIVTCTTCHFPHGGERIYFARMDFSMDICMKCHTGSY